MSGTQDPIVQRILSHPDDFSEGRRRELEELGRKFFDARLNDNQFSTELPKEPHRRYWEMVVGCILLKLGLTVVNPRGGPDFKVELGGRSIWIEATSPDCGSGSDRVPDGPGWRRGDLIELRFTNAISGKMKQCLRRIGPRDPFIIAINGYHIGRGSDAFDLCCALFGVGPLVDRFLTDEAGRLIYLETFRQGELENVKSSGEHISKAGFLDGRLERLSAVIFASVNINWPLKDIRRELRLIRNPRARNPLPPSALDRITELQAPLTRCRYDD